MLSGSERLLMDGIYPLMKGGTLLISPKELSAFLDKSEVESTLLSLKSEDYIDFLSSERKGEPVYLITLKVKGECYPKERRKEKKQLLLRLAMAIGGAIVSFLVGLFLKMLVR